MADIDEVKQMLYLFGVEFNEVDLGGAVVFDILKFGTKVLFIKEEGFSPNLVKGIEEDHCRAVLIYEDDDMEIKRMDFIWVLVEGGYFHDLRMTLPNTFKRLIITEGWDRKIIEKRLGVYGDLPKYNYLRELNKEALGLSSTYVLSVDPGFFDFLLAN